MNNHYPFQAVPLPYLYDALEPHIDMETLHFHHDKHYQTYVDKLNQLLEPYKQYHLLDLKELLTSIEDLPREIQTPIQNNAGGVFNHELYFSLMCKPNDDCAKNRMLGIIIEQFGSFEEFKADFKSAGISQFGSGYAWLISVNGKLSIEKTSNQNTPNLKHGNPILLVDVWEHAYYLKYQNRRADYLDNWFSVINWTKVEELY